MWDFYREALFVFSVADTGHIASKPGDPIGIGFEEPCFEISGFGDFGDFCISGFIPPSPTTFKIID
jgi:hypothetical protein